MFMQLIIKFGMRYLIYVGHLWALECKSSAETFLQECKLLTELKEQIAAGQPMAYAIAGETLIDMLNNYALLKEQRTVTVIWNF